MFPAIDPVVPPLPIWSVPVATVVVPVKVFDPVSVSMPSPSFVSVPPTLESPVARVTSWPLVSSL